MEWIQWKMSYKPALSKQAQEIFFFAKLKNQNMQCYLQQYPRKSNCISKTPWYVFRGIAELQDSGRKSWTLDCGRLTVDTGA